MGDLLGSPRVEPLCFFTVGGRGSELPIGDYLCLGRNLVGLKRMTEASGYMASPCSRWILAKFHRFGDFFNFFYFLSIYTFPGCSVRTSPSKRADGAPGCLVPSCPDEVGPSSHFPSAQIYLIIARLLSGSIIPALMHQIPSELRS